MQLVLDTDITSYPSTPVLVLLWCPYNHKKPIPLTQPLVQ